MQFYELEGERGRMWLGGENVWGFFWGVGFSFFFSSFVCWLAYGQLVLVIF